MIQEALKEARQCGPNDWRVAETLDLLAKHYSSDESSCSLAPPTRKFSRAETVKRVESLYIDSLECREKALGKDHPDVEISLFNLAQLYEGKLGNSIIIPNVEDKKVHANLIKARQLYMRAREITERTFGNNSPRVLANLSRIVHVSDELRDYADSIQNLKRMVELSKNFDTVLCNSYLAELALRCYVSDDNSESDKYFTQILNSPGNYATPAIGAATFNNFGVLRFSQKQYSAAEQLFSQALKAAETDPEMFMSWHSGNNGLVHRIKFNMAMVLSAQQKYEVAEQYFRQALYLETEPLSESMTTLTAMHLRHNISADAAFGYRHPTVLICGESFDASSRHFEPLNKCMALGYEKHLKALGNETRLALLKKAERLTSLDSFNCANMTRVFRRFNQLLGCKPPSSTDRLDAECTKLFTLGESANTKHCSKTVCYPPNPKQAKTRFDAAAALAKQTDRPSLWRIGLWKELSTQSSIYTPAEREQFAKNQIADTESLFGKKHLYLVDELTTLSEILNEQRKYTEAQTLILQAEQIASADGRKQYPMLVEILAKQARLSQQRKDSASASGYLERAIATAQEYLGQTDPAMANLHEARAICAFRAGDLECSQKHYELALNCLKPSDYLNDPTSAILLNDLAVIYAMRGELSSAVKTISKSMQLADGLAPMARVQQIERNKLVLEKMASPIFATELNGPATQLAKSSLGMASRRYPPNCNLVMDRPLLTPFLIIKQTPG